MTPAQLFNELLNELEIRQNNFVERNRESSRRWREKQNREQLRRKWRTWEKTYRMRNKNGPV